MEAALVGVGVGAMKPLLSKLYKMVEEDVAKTKGVSRLVESSRDEMRSMEAALETLQDVEELDPEMVIWRDDVRELSYDMEDCVDYYMACADHKHDGPTGFMGFIDRVTKLKPRHHIAGKIKKLNKRAIEASEKHKRYKAENPTPNPTTSQVDPRLHALYVEVSKLVGIDGPKEHIIECLNREGSSQSQLQVVSIVGPGGLGKTTLANAVYQYIRGDFSCAAFVSVSRKPNIKDVLRDIAERVGITDNTSNDNKKRLIDRIRDHLKNKRYFIVVDDIWSAGAWNTIKDALINNNHGSKIITSTRSNTVASCCCSQGGYIYKMEPLSLIDSRRLFYERAFGSEHLFPPNLKEISERILEKCAGLPLAIITLSSLLADQTAKLEWERVLAAIGSSLTKESKAVDMKRIISLSYFDLPYPVRACFLYLSAFPEDHIIEKQSLIHKWIAEGFIPEGQVRSTYEVGEAYFYDLINRSLIQPITENDSYNLVGFGQVEECQVHDIILDFITCKASEENFMTPFDEVEHGRKQKVRRLSVVSRNNSQMAIVPGDLDHVRSLVIFGYLGQSSLLGFPALRVLDLGECLELENNHLENIGKLFLLKYLRLGPTSIRESYFRRTITKVPENIGELQNLETLDLRGTNIQKLPSTITRLQRLRRLYCSPYCCSSYQSSPEDHMVEQLACSSSLGEIGQLQSLEELVNIHVHPPQAWKSLQELVSLTKLRTLDVAVMYPLHFRGDDGAEDVKEFIGNLLSSFNLHQLCIQYGLEHNVSDLLSLESFCPANPDKLQTFCIRRYYIDKIPTWMRSLVNLRKLVLQMYRMEQEDIDILGAIPALAFLNLQTHYGRHGRIFIRGFRSLKYFYLQITYCGTAVEFEKGSMPKLETLKLKLNAHREECVNGASDLGIQHLSALTKVEVFVVGYAVDSLIIEAVATLPNRPTLSLKHPPKHKSGRYCRHFRRVFTKLYEDEARVSNEFRKASFSSYLGQIVQEINQDAMSTTYVNFQNAISRCTVWDCIWAGSANSMSGKWFLLLLLLPILPIFLVHVGLW